MRRIGIKILSRIETLPIDHHCHRITVNVMSGISCCYWGFLEEIVVNYFLRKTSLVTHVGKIRDVKGEILYQSTLFIIDVCHSLYD